MERNNRATLNHIILVNWKGMFFHPFEIAKGVTSLSGENGSGKTTTMIAGYLGLLPDLVHLKFDNTSELGASGGDNGIYGRLGEKGCSYSILDLENAKGERVYMGIHLQKKLQPSIELTRFIVTGISAQTDSKTVFLKESDGAESLLELSDLREHVALQGGHFDSCKTVSEYTSKLFDLGILPIRMESPMERKKFSRMLQTCMFGGLSKELQAKLKDYLLTEDTTLRNHVAVMCENLEACRATRDELTSTQKKQKTIQSLLKAGYGMFEAAFSGTRLRAESNRRTTVEKYKIYRKSSADLEEAATREKEFARMAEEAKENLEQTSTEADQAKIIFDSCTRARDIVISIDKSRADLFTAEAELVAAMSMQQEAERRYSKADNFREQTIKEQTEIARGLADAQKAWEDLLKKVSLYRTAVQSLQDVRKAIPDKKVSEENAKAVQEECSLQWESSLKEKSEIEQKLAGLDERRKRFEEVYGTLVRLAGSRPQEKEAFELAKSLDADFREKENIIEKSAEYPILIDNARERANRQDSVKKKTQQFQKEGIRFSNGAEFLDLLRQKRTFLEEKGKEERALREESGKLQALFEKEKIELTILVAKLEDWTIMQRLLDELCVLFVKKFRTREELASFEVELEGKRQDLEKEISLLSANKNDHFKKAEDLEHNGGRIDKRLINLRDKLANCKLVAEIYDDVSEEKAAEIEAALGPLHEALIVDDIAQAANLIATDEDMPPHVWLMLPESGIEPPASKQISQAELVKMGEAWRLSRHPKRPVIGFTARQNEIDRLRQAGKEIEEKIYQLSGQADDIKRGFDLVAKMKKFWNLIGSESPETELNKLIARKDKYEKDIKKISARVTELLKELQAAEAIIKRLEEILPDIRLLDEEDLYAIYQKLRDQLGAANDFKKELREKGNDIAMVRRDMIELAAVPPGIEKIEELRRILQKAEGSLNYWKTARELLRELIFNLDYLQYRPEEELLGSKKSILGELKQKQEGIEKTVANATREAQEAKKKLQAADNELNTKKAVETARRTQIGNLEQALQEAGESGTEESLEEAKKLFREAKDQHNKAQEKERQTHTDFITAKVEAKNKQNTETEKRKEFIAEREKFIPGWRTWLDLRRSAVKHGYLHRLHRREVVEEYARLGHVQSFTRSRTYRRDLEHVLKGLDDGDAIWEKLKDIFGLRDSDDDGRIGQLNLEGWLTVKSYLERQIPRDLVQADDPEEVIRQLDTHINRLQERLQDQEARFRSKTDSVANSINSKINREYNQISRLSSELRTVSFGTVKSIRIKIHRIETMGRLLNSMRIQPELFNQNLSLEEALLEMYRKEGGGRIKGEQLLDYREYIDMAVEVQKEGSDKWIRATSNTLSTGESIGVGAAVLMAVLAHWETQAKFLRGERASKSLRFLALDEVARLSTKSLDTLAEFCERMDMQLLVAAPSSDRARKGIRHLLVRSLDENNQERVTVRGTRFTEGKVLTVGNA